MRFAIGSACLVLPALLCAQSAVGLAEITVYSTRVANQSPAGTFAMPVSSLRFEPRVDIHARNLAEGQSDVTIRGGIFENTAFQIGVVTVVDPQTGHYFAELPVAPAMLSAPQLVLGADLGLGATNATVGAVAYGWRPVHAGGAVSASLGEFGLRRAEVYQGVVTKSTHRGIRYGADIALAQSSSDGSVPFGDHDFERANVRLQRASGSAQTDLFAGYQRKRFGWPNLYTPFNSNETENLQTVLVAANHRVEAEPGEFLEAGAYYRRNKDDYAFNRFAPLGPVHPFQHTSWVRAAAVEGRRDFDGLALNFRAEVIADEIRSTSLTFGRFRTRTLTKVAIAPEMTWVGSAGTRTGLKAGLAYEDTNRDAGSWSPVVELARTFPSAALRRTHLSYTRTSQVPTYTALNSSAAAGLFRGNPNLGREKSDNIEAGIAGSLAGWALEGAVFWRRDGGLVDWTFRRGVTARTANAVDVEVSGLELLARRNWQAIDLVLGYTALTKDHDYRGAAVDGSFYALNYARHRLTAALTARLGRGFELRVDNVARIQAASPLRTVGGDRAVSTAVGLSFRPATWRKLEFSVNVDNLWDSRFQEVPAVPAARRQMAVGVGYGW